MSINTIFENIKSNPPLAYNIIVAILSILLIGYIQKWHWVLDPTGNNKSIFLIRLLGNKYYRIAMIVMLTLVILGIGIILILG